MTPGEPGGGERRATPERGEKFSASPRLKEHIIQGVFEGPTGPRVATAKEVSKNSFDALNAHHYDLRKKDNQRVREQIKANLRPEQRSMLAAKIKEDHPNYTQDQIKAQVEYQHHLGEWAIAERVRLSQVAIAAKESDQVQVLGEAMQALGLPTDPNALILSFYNTGSFEGGTFYKKFCTGDVNRNFAEKLTVEQMFVLKPFLKDLLGDTHIERTTGQTSDVAFNALVALRESMEALKNPQALIQAGESNTALSLADTAVLKFYQEGLQLAQPNEPKQTQGVHSPNNQDELNNRNQETAQPEKVRTAKQEIFEKAGKRSLEEAQTLFTEMTKVLEEEQKVGQGKFRETIAETKAALEADPKAKEVLKRSGIVRDGATVYVPDDGGIMIDFGDVHGDFDVVKRIIETEQFIENQE
ncbi:MAG TPA: hypothetical protein VN711_01710, partial [Candidatus Saccharimonadales bacterium]|nr:hypothetical protein [Candidatus Saccharimonadales bacterium]